MDATFESNRNTARLAACIFFLVCWPTSWWAQGYVPSKVFVLGDAAATASNLLSNEFIFRTGIAINIAGIMAFACMSMLLYRVFSPVDKLLSLMMVIVPIMQVIIIFTMELLNITSVITLASPESSGLTTSDDAQRQQVVYFLMRMHRNGMLAYEIFWGPWMLLVGALLYKSGFAPRILAILTLVGGIGYGAMGFAFILLQHHDYVMVRPYLKIVKIIGLAASMLWFLIKGVRNPMPIANQR